MTTSARPLTEAEWQRQVTDLAALLGWTWAHFRPARTEQGWRTPVEGPGGAGFPDLVLWRDRVIFVELKAERGQLRTEQAAVLRDLAWANAEVYVWRPSEFPIVRQHLERRT